MSLISKKVAIETLALNTDYQTPEGIKNDLINHPGKECDWLGGIDEAISIIAELPSVPAVPLDKLCEWMADNVYLKDDTEEAWKLNPDNWKKLLANWMEEQDESD